MAKGGRRKVASAGRFVEAVLWVAEHIGEAGVEEKGSPSGLAWAIWKWVVSEGQDKFFSILLPRALATESGLRGEEEIQKAERMSLAEVEGMLRPLLGGVERRFCEKCWRELAADGCPEGVRVVHVVRSGSPSPGVEPPVDVPGDLQVMDAELAGAGRAEASGSLKENQDVVTG